MQPLRIFEEHKGVVEDVAWSRHNENIFGSVGDDKNMIIYDLRSDKPSYTIEAHSLEVNSIDFNYFNNNLILSGSNDKTIALWDMRNLSHKLHTFESHKNEVISARWNPRIETLFASSSADRRINVWDLGQISAKQSAVDAEDGPPELLVYHILINSSFMEDILQRYLILVGTQMKT
jgi:histone-binding protein RBBP4